MAQLFSPGTTTLFRLCLGILPVFVVGLFLAGELQHSLFIWEGNYREQPL